MKAKSTIKALFAVVSVSLAAASAQAQSYPDQVSFVSQWCDDVVGTLVRKEQQAKSSIYLGRYEEAVSVLTEGLVRAAQIPPQISRRPLTARAIVRGITISQAIQQATGGVRTAARTQAYFLSSYYQFIYKVASDIDRPYWIPYNYGCGRHGCHNFDMVDFERRQIRYIEAQLGSVLSSLATTQGYGRVFPIGAPQAYLTALELVAGYASEDVLDSIWAAQHACLSSDLAALSQRLAAYNHGGGGGYYSAPEAMASSYYEAKQLTAEVGNSVCFSHRY